MVSCLCTRGGGGGRPRLEGGKGCSKAPLSLSRDAAPEFNRLHFETTLKLISPPEFSLKPATLPTPLGAGRLILFKACKAGNIRLRFIGRSVVRTNESRESLQTRETIRSILSRRGLPVIFVQRGDSKGWRGLFYASSDFNVARCCCENLES